MIKAYFMDNQTVGADELNALVRMFAGAGVADVFSDGVPYNVSALNGVYYAALKPGVVPESDVSLSVTASDGAASIAPGTAIFPDGTYAVVSAESGTNESVSYTSGAEQYIYLKSDRVSNTVSLLAASSAPGDSDNAVLLAKIGADGSVTDMRSYAKGKIPGTYASDAFLAGRRVFSLDYDTDSVTFSSNGAGYNYMFVMGKCKQSYGNKNVLACVDLNSMASISAANRGGSTDGDNQKFYVRTDGTFIAGYTIVRGITYELFGKVSVTDGTFTIAFTKQSYSGESEWNDYVFPAEIEILLV